MTNKTLAYGLLISFGLSVCVSLFELSPELYTLSGLGQLFFGIWGAVRLIKSDE